MYIWNECIFSMTTRLIAVKCRVARTQNLSQLCIFHFSSITILPAITSHHTIINTNKYQMMFENVAISCKLQTTSSLVLRIFSFEQ